MITKALEEYLKTMYILDKQNGEIRVTDIAKKMNVSRKTISQKIKLLKDKGVIIRVGSAKKGYWKKIE